MLSSSAKILIGCSLLFGTMFLVGFLFFYDSTSPPSTTAEPVESTTISAAPLLLAINSLSTPKTFETTSSLVASDSVTTADVTTKKDEISQMNNYGQCGVPAADFLAKAADAGDTSLVVKILQSRIIGGTTAIEGEWPWMAYLYELPLGRKHGGICGGTLISRKWVVSAAHCIETNVPSLYGILLGAHKLSAPSVREVERRVKRIIIHPRYDPVSFNYDVALLELDELVIYTEFIRPLCVASVDTHTDDTEANSTFAGKVCSTLGWGITSFSDGTRPDTLMHINLAIMPAMICQITTLQNSVDYRDRPVREGSPKFCAGGSAGEDTCNGDSGGPLACRHSDGLYYLHGITSYGTTVCAQAKKPGVYTKVADTNVNNFIISNVDFTT